MKVEIEFTHQNGRLIKGPGRRPPLRGNLGMFVRFGKSGSYSVAELRSAVPVQPALAELRDAHLYCIGGDGFQLRGLECVMRDGVEHFVLQGWLVTVRP